MHKVAHLVLFHGTGKKESRRRRCRMLDANSRKQSNVLRWAIPAFSVSEAIIA